MKKQQVLFGILSAVIGFICFVFIISLSSKPINAPITFDPVDSLQSYFFSFVWSLGDIGYVVGGIVLLVYLALFYFLGIKISQMRNKPR